MLYAFSSLFIRYRDRAASNTLLGRAGFDNAAEVDFIFLWLFGVSAPILMIITFFDLFCGIKATHFIVSIPLAVWWWCVCVFGGGGRLSEILNYCRR